jgi:hypothetical protein
LLRFSLAMTVETLAIDVDHSHVLRGDAQAKGLTNV